MRTLFPLAACLAAVAAPLSAAAPAATTSVIEVRIAFDAVDLSDAAERSALEQRIEAQLRSVCTVEASGLYGRQRDFIDQRCLTQARADAMAQLEAAALAAADNAEAPAAS